MKTKPRYWCKHHGNRVTYSALGVTIQTALLIFVVLQDNPVIAAFIGVFAGVEITILVHRVRDWRQCYRDRKSALTDMHLYDHSNAKNTTTTATCHAAGKSHTHRLYKRSAEGRRHD